MGKKLVPTIDEFFGQKAVSELRSGHFYDSLEDFRKLDPMSQKLSKQLLREFIGDELIILKGLMLREAEAVAEPDGYVFFHKFLLKQLMDTIEQFF